jgi:hypothetical protein
MQVILEACALASAGSQLSAKLLTFGINLTIARYLSPEAYGVSGHASAATKSCVAQSRKCVLRTLVLCPAARSSPPSSSTC